MTNIVKGLVCSIALFAGLGCGQVDGMRPIQVAVRGISDKLQDIIRIDDIDSFQKCLIFENNPNFDQFILSACRYGSLKIFKFCFLNGARNNLLQLRQGDATALMLALRGGNTDIIHILMDDMGAQIDLSAMNDDNINLLYHAYNSSNLDIVTWLKDIYGADFEGNAGRLFAVACKNNESDVATRLVTNYRDRIDPKAVFRNKSAIEYALENGNLEILHMIFNERGLGIDINSPVRDPIHLTMCPLEYAVALQLFMDYRQLRDGNLSSRVYETIAYLLRNGADIFKTGAVNTEPIICTIAENYNNYQDAYESPTWTDKVFKLAIQYNYIDKKPKCDVNTIFPGGGALIHRISDPYRLKVLLKVPGINIDLPAPGSGKSLRDKLEMNIEEFVENMLSPGLGQDSDEQSMDQEDTNEMIHILDEYKATHPQTNN